MSVWTPEYFAKDLNSLAKQVLPKEVYKSRGVRGLECMNLRILQVLDRLRKNLGVPLTVNGGGRNQSGLRTEAHYSSIQNYLNSYSQHKLGNALDFVSSAMTAIEIRNHIITNKELYPEITFIEVGKLKNGEDMTWVHIDCRNHSKNGIIYWSPLYGYVTEERVLTEKL